MTLRVLIADDEPLIRAGLRVLIEAEPDLTVVGEAADGAEALSQTRALRPQLILMDVRMPAVDGLQATSAILARVPDPPKVVVITTFENDEHVFAALRAGASGFLLKRARPEELLQALRTVAHGDSLLFPASVRRLAAAYGDRRDGTALRSLTGREADVLRLVAEGSSNAEIAERLFIGVETVKTHVGNVLAKLGARDRVQAVIIAYESGFVSPSR